MESEEKKPAAVEMEGVWWNWRVYHGWILPEWIINVEDLRHE